MKLSGANVLLDVPNGNFDAHAHVFDKNLPLASDRRYTPKNSATLSMLSDNLRALSLDGALLVQPSFLGADNSFLIKALKAQQNSNMTFRGVAVVNKDASEENLAELAQKNIVGLRLNLVKSNEIEQFNIKDWEHVLRTANALGWHVELHCQGANILSIAPALLENCERVVIDHFGRPNHESPMECPGFKYLLRDQSGQMFVKVSAPYRVFPDAEVPALHNVPKAVFSELLSALGPDRLMWGSDWPWTQHEHFGFSYAETRAWYQSWTEALPPNSTRS